MPRSKIYRLAAAVVSTALAIPAASAQNLLERSVSPPLYEAPSPQYEAPPPPRPKPKVQQPQAPQLPRPGSATAVPGANPATPGANPGAPGTNPAAAEEPAPPYEPQLLRLSELLGALTYLQDLCGGQGGQVWRDKMTALMDAETQSELRKERLAGAYNRGFTGYELSYRQCTPNAQAIISRFLDESGKIARDVSHRYGTS
jgi:uncharacterized protein (TIGR02301 family)